MRRWMPSLPRYRQPLILQESVSGPEQRAGYNRQGTMYARVLRAFDILPESGRSIDGGGNNPLVAMPTDTPPSTNLVEPTARFSQWVPWWGNPPDSNRQNYKIPDPPTIARPVRPTATLPILYEARAVVGSGAWHADLLVSAIYIRGEWAPRVGKEVDQDNVLLDLSYASVKVRPSAIKSLGIQAKRWEIIHVDTDTVWDIEYIRDSYRRNEYVELLVKEKR